MESSKWRILMGLLFICTTSASADMFVSPERTTQIVLSNRDVNRVVCEDGRMGEVFASEEKGVVVQTTEHDAFVKLHLKRNTDTGAVVRPTIDVDLHMVCAGEVYTLIGKLKTIPAQTIRLRSGSGNAKANLKRMRGMPEERRIQLLMREAYKDAFPRSYVVEDRNEVVGTLGEGEVALIRDVRVEGVGLRMKIYKYTATEPVALTEPDFIRPLFGKHIAAVSIDSSKKRLDGGESVRVFVIERATQ